MAKSDTRSIRITPQNRNASQSNRSQTDAGTQVATTDSVRYLTMVASKTSATDQDLEFVFAFPPQQVSYSAFAPEISEIRRPGRKPLVAFTSFQSRKVDIEFLVAVPFDGLFTDIENDIDLVRQIVQSGRPVVFVNTDQFLGSEFAETLSESSPYWSITNMGVQSMRRNGSGKIVSAQVSLSLVENVNPDITIVELAPIQYEESPTPQNESGGSESKEEDFIKWTEAWENSGRTLIGDS